MLLSEARVLGRGTGWVSPRNATAGPCVRQQLWAFKVAVETVLLVTGRSLLLSRQGPPHPCRRGPPPRAPGTPQTLVSAEGTAVLMQLGGLGCVAPSSTDPPPQLALGMAGGAR